MTFKKLSEYFDKLEQTSSRNAMVEILGELFKETSVEEIDKVAYLTQGRVAPLYEPVELGMAEKMVLKSISLAYDKPLEEATDAFKKTGDLGEVAQHLRSLSNLRDLRNLSVKEVFEKLLEIARTGGEGSVEKKVGTLAELLKESDPLSARYIARIPVDKMRLGFSDMTVLEGLSWMLDGTKKNKDRIEAAYNIRPDLGYIVKQVKEFGLAGIEHVKPAVKTPILSMRAERLTNAKDILEKAGGKAAVEPKIDGLRTQLHLKRIASSVKRKENCEVRLYSRGLENVTTMYPDLVEAAEKEVDCEDVILDGEAIGFDPKTGKYLPFQETVQRKRKYDIDLFSKNFPLKLVVFDVLIYNGKSYINEPYTKRRELVEKLLKNNQIIVPAEMKVMDNPNELKKFFDESVKKGLEGIMAKKLDGVYQAGARGWNWIKLKASYEGKMNDTVDAVVMGYDFGQGKRNKFGVGAFLIGIFDQKTDTFKTISKVGTGLTDEEWRELAKNGQELKVAEKPKNFDVNKVMAVDVWMKPKLVGVFRADQLTKSPMHTAGYALRFPRLDNWRTDKQPEDATSLMEIHEMAKLQK
ncbi:ATP-dependent DNA ligase [Patescibacteria group bacterium]|nr:ATP-dependent DNA ligase [Patescibacteria group bacterium]